MNEKQLRLVYIFYSGYSTRADFTLAEWFEAQEFVKNNRALVLRILKA